ncbi:type I restriction enzyme R subunit [Ancylomarina subtilis]|uniref:Type I restriction enzyme endonuclease subunit n=1 Tax=Ancylomarina subtilis TaxID=1639035 RepID=A0A4Q7VEN6_9BACT|nr:type I restriction endonuclease subunit R [Ancylomarina subtilis]RZT93578.1 type I restriction enzyme R subunit [Ancylomarina subtilis]
MINEDQLEQLALTWFQDNGYNYLHGADIAPESATPYRNDFREVILAKECFEALSALNPGIPSAKIEEVIRLVSNPDGVNTVYKNKAFHKMLLDGVQVEFEHKGENIKDLVYLIDFNSVAANRFLVVNQYSIAGEKHTRRPDIMVFINGLPISILELKNPANEDTDIWDAYNQLQTYKKDIEDLFVFNEALVVSDGITARIGSLTANKERFMPWRTIDNEHDRPLVEFELEKVIKGFFKPELFLDYLRHFILFEGNGNGLIKKIAAYHQFHAVREAVKATIKAASVPQLAMAAEPRANYTNTLEPGSKKAGVIWHTQGSGKSISMVCYAGKLLQQAEMQNPTIVVVTDRSDLDGQLFKTFSQSADLLKQEPVQANSREDLRDILEARKSGGIVFTTIQKFSLYNGESKHPLLSKRHNIVVISDEAHRSQYGDKAKLDTKTGVYKYGFSQHMRDALNNATFIGFTGTPISMVDKDTQNVFGSYVSIYDIQDAVDDGATVPIFYESRLAKLDINQAEIEKLNQDVEEVIEDEEDLVTREKTKSKWAELEKLVGAENRMLKIAADLVNHYQQRIQIIDGKAMIVCMSRDICVQMYNHITAIKPEWHNDDPSKGNIKVIMTGSASDKESIQDHVHTKKVKKDLENRFKDENDDLQIVIVRDMWLTGFDAPPCHTMYVDKPMKGHNLMQAIARVNRVFKNKPGGLVVDYIGIANELKWALKTYTESKGKGSPTNKAQEAFVIFQNKLDALRGMFHGFNYSDFETKPLELLIPATNHILEDSKNGKKRFLDLMAAINSALALCGTLDEINEYKIEIAFFNAIKATIIKHTSVDKKRLEEEKNSALKQILDNAVVAEGVEDIFKLAGLEKPNIGLLSEDFLEDVRRLKMKNFAVALLEKLLKDNIKAHSRGNLVQEQKYGDRLLESLRKYHNRQIETAQVIEELIQMAKDFQKDMEREKDLGLNIDEIRFYDALASNESAVRELHEETLKQIAIELTEKLRNSTTVDWQVRDSVRAKIRNMVRRLLRRYKYPPDQAPQAIELILKQAEVLADGWTN